MNAIRRVFPESKNLLCVWHIYKNLASHCKQGFSADEWTGFMGDWNEVIKMGSVTNFEERWKELERKYINHPNVIKYLKNTWEPLEEHFVTAWTSKCLHL